MQYYKSRASAVLGAVLAAILGAILLAIPQPVMAQNIDFGDDESQWANDGECDDMRFEGAGMTETNLLDSDIKHDATDCRTAYDQGRLTFISDDLPPPANPHSSARISAQSARIIWGDDTGDWARDGECDDMRFEGAGMTDTNLLESDVKHDATDCRVAYEQGRLRLAGTEDETADAVAAVPTRQAEGVDFPIRQIKFGNDSGKWAKDNECDDPRFVGEGMADSLGVFYIGKDASDCRKAYQQGKVNYNRLFLPPSDENPIDFGDNDSEYPNDGQCDDIRFTGDYADNMVFLSENIGHDANDCRAAVDSGKARWQGNTIPPKYGMRPDEDA